MTFVIASACIDVLDESCIEVCPVDCIYTEDSDRMCYIEPNECIDCGLCESACPVGAIFDEPEVPRDAAQFTEINALWFEDKEGARTRVEKYMDGGPEIT